MAVFGELQTAISKRLLDANNTAVSSSDTAAALNDTIAYYKFKRFWFNEAQSTQTMTLDDATIPLPSDFLMPAYDDGSFIISYSDQRYPLKKVNQVTYDAQFFDNGNGLPQIYARVGGGYECYPIPDRAYSVIVRYLKDYDAIDAANYNAVNDFITNAPRLLVLWSCANLIAELRQDDKMEAYFRKASMNEENNLLSRTNKENGSGSISIY